MGEKFDGRIERGIVLSVNEQGAAKIASYDRPGVVTRPLKALFRKPVQTGWEVLFLEFENGNGVILSHLDPDESRDDSTSGAPGKSAYEIWLEAGNTGTVEDFLASLVGPAGPAGPEGPQGPAGSDANITKEAIEAELIGTITSHTHNFEDLMGIPSMKFFTSPSEFGFNVTPETTLQELVLAMPEVSCLCFVPPSSATSNISPSSARLGILRIIKFHLGRLSIMFFKKEGNVFRYGLYSNDDGETWWTQDWAEIGENVAITKAAVEGVLTGNITSHNHTPAHIGAVNASDPLISNKLRDSRITTGNTQVANASSNQIYLGNPATRLQLESSQNPTLNVASNNYTLYHTGNKPSAADVGAVATSAYTAADVLAKLKTVDGPGSGLESENSDKLDGLHASDFSRTGVISSGSLDDVTAPGVYYVNNISDAPSSTKYGALYVAAYGTSVNQTYIPHTTSSPRIYFRRKSGSWGGWYQSAAMTAV